MNKAGHKYIHFRWEGKITILTFQPLPPSRLPGPGVLSLMFQLWLFWIGTRMWRFWWARWTAGWSWLRTWWSRWCRRVGSRGWIFFLGFIILSPFFVIIPPTCQVILGQISIFVIIIFFLFLNKIEKQILSYEAYWTQNRTRLFHIWNNINTILLIYRMPFNNDK